MIKVAISSILGSPHDSKTWSAAPWNLSNALPRHGVQTVPIDSSYLTKLDKGLMIAPSLFVGLPWRAVSWSAAARKMRGKYVAKVAARTGVDHVLCCGSLDCPESGAIPYSIWIDNSLNLLCNSPLAPTWSARTRAKIDELERAAFHGAAHIFSFSEHVRSDLLEHYGVPDARVLTVGCGSGEVAPLMGPKDYASGYLLFVAKHAFTEKGGELLLAAYERIKEQRPETRLVIVGSDAVVDRVKSIPGVEAFGWVTQEKLAELFHGAAMLVQPMLGDSWGQVYLEAMKAKAVIVALNRGALPELTNNGTLAALVDQPDPEQLAAAVLGIYRRNPAELQAMTEVAQTQTVERFNWDAVAARVAAQLMSSADCL